MNVHLPMGEYRIVPAGLPEHLKLEAKALQRKGLTMREIAKELEPRGVSYEQIEHTLYWKFVR
jgi:orotate phosphoribosyltransferase-like protein